MKKPSQASKLSKPAAYDPAKIEKKWQKKWRSADRAGVGAKSLYTSKEDSTKDKFYVLDMFPYPSGEGLHVGHPKGYIATDVISRMNRMQGKSVLHPMGFDAFGLPAENYAIKTKTNPEIAVAKNVARYKEQLQLLGLDYDWSREINTTDPDYYRWTQWIFLQLYKKGLAFESNEPVNWCPTDKTVLANEDVENGRCERCGTPVEKKPLRQWVLKITDYAERLLKDLDAKKQPERPLLIDRVNPHQPGKPIVKREVAHAIVYDPKAKKYLIIRNKKFGWDTVIIGGIENGEDAVETARREVREETGYTDLEFKRVLGGQTEAHYYTKHKGQNRIAYATAVYFELKSDARVAIASGEDADNEILWIDEKDFVPGKMVNSELPIWLARLSVNVEFNRKGTDIPLFTEIRGASAFKEDAKNVERDAFAVILKHWSEDKYVGLKWKNVNYRTIITGGSEGAESLEAGVAREITEETGFLNAKLKKHLGKVDANFYHQTKNVNRIGHFDVLYFELTDGERKELSAEDQKLHEVVWLSKEDMSDFLNSAAQRYIWNTLFLGKPNEFAEANEPLLDWPASIKELQRNWIGKSEGAEIDFTLTMKNNKTRFVILHGYKEYIDKGYSLWLKSELEKRGHEVEVPVLPNTELPVEKEQVDFVLKNCTFDENTVLIGHSLGGIVALKTLMKLNRPISGLVLVAPAIQPGFSPDSKPRPFHSTFNWEFNFDLVKKITNGKIAVLSDTAETHRAPYLKYLSEKLFARLIETQAVGKHFNAEIEPEVLKAVTPSVKVFTTRPDTLFGVTYVTLAPENPWVQIMMPFIENKTDVEAYILKAQKESEIERTDATREKTGVELKGIKAINPANGEEVPVWIADYVLADYGTGAVMAVPAHDERDYDFAEKYNLKIKTVITPPAEVTGKQNEVYLGVGYLENSNEFNGIFNEDAKVEITKKFGSKKISYKLRDWVFSRQRYWGEPIPLIHCPTCGVVPVPEKELPVNLPKVKSYEPTGTGESPLANIDSWVNVKCPQCKGKNDKPKYFIFDFDGVLGDTWEALIKAKLKMGDGADRESIIAKTAAYFSSKPEDSRGHTLSPEEMAKKVEWIEVFGKHMSETKFELFKGFVREIKKIKGAKLAVVSAGSKQYVIPALKKSGLDFTHILAYEDHHSKEEKIENICKDWNVSVKDIYYFTDSQADVYELENQLDKKKLIGCAWGYSGFDNLKKVLPENQILKNFKDIHAFFKTAGMARRETNTMPQWAGSCWYYLRFMDPKNKKAFADPKKEKYWAPVDLYVGGAEHATRHLIYARFWHKVLFDLGYVSTLEPFMKLQHVGLIMGADGHKMSKRFGNVINPDDMVKTFGADALRVYEMFMGPFDQQISWSSESIVGTRRFIERVWRLRERVSDKKGESDENFRHFEGKADFDKKEIGTIHKAIKKVTEDIQGLRFNTAISTLMIAVNELEKLESVSMDSYSKLLKLIAPFAPHVTDELWASLGNKKSIHVSDWPVFDPALAAESESTIIVQVNGKVRGSFTVRAGAGKDELLAMAKELPEIKKWLDGKPIKKEIVVPGRLVNLVV